MRYTTRIKPISHLKANAAEVLSNLAEQPEYHVVTQNGQAKAVLQDIRSFEQTQETLAMLKLLARDYQDIEAGKTMPADEFIARLRTAQ